MIPTGVASGMLRKLLVAFGIVEIIKPGPIIDACERIGLENTDEARLRPLGNVLARLEGLLFVWVLVRGRERSPLTSSALTLAGLVAAVYPRPLIRLSQAFAYDNPEELRLRSWVEPAARLLGILYLLVVYLSSREE